MNEPPPFISARPRLSINGSERRDLDDAVLEAVTQHPLAGQAQAEIRLSNWGAPDSGNGEPEYRFQDLELGDRIEVMLGETAQRAVFQGDITALEERYGDGAPQLVILAEDALHRLARQRHSREFADTGLEQLVRDIADQAGLDSDVQIGDAIGQWLQLNESNLAFLLRLLMPLAIWPRIHDGGLRARPEQPDPEPQVLDLHDNLLRARLIADLNHQPGTLQVRGFDLAADQAVEAEAASLQPQPAGVTAADALNDLGWEGEADAPQPFAFNQAYADLLAAGRFQRQAWQFAHGDATCSDTPELTCGREVDLRGVSERLAGKWRVMHCSHRFDGSAGLRTQVRLNRPDWEA